MIALTWVTAFLSGAGVLVVELVATRALAPYFGQALFVWTNVIGLVLFGLALGAFVGGRLADRRPSPRVLAWMIFVAAGLVALAAVLPAHVARLVLPRRLPLEASYEFLLRGSFLTTLICFVPPVLLLGAVPPFLVRCSARSITEVGARAGSLYGASTLGSILGTFLTSYVLVPALGTRGSLLLAAGLLAVSAAPLLLARRVRGEAALVLVAGLLAASCALTPWARAAPAGMSYGELVAARDSRYQHIEIRRRSDLGALVLSLDEGHDSFHSMLPDSGYLTGAYYDAFNVIAAHAVDQGRLRVLILGLAGGTQARQLLHFFGDRCALEIVGVELDPVVVELARAHLELPQDPRLEVISGMDGRAFLTATDGEFDLLVVDCYSHQSYLPFHLASREFFIAARNRLRRGGILALNLSGYGAVDPVVAAVTNTLASAFSAPVASVALPGTINHLVYAVRDAPAPLPGEMTGLLLAEELREVHAAISVPGRAFRTGVRGSLPVLRDDSGILERMQESRLARRAEALLGGDP